MDIVWPIDRLKVVVCLSPKNLLFILEKTKSEWANEGV